MVNNFFVINDNLITTNLLIYNNHELITILSDYSWVYKVFGVVRINKPPVAEMIKKEQMI